MGPKSKGHPMQKNWVLNWVIAPSVLLPSLAFAVPVNLTCTTDPLTTSVAIFTRGSDITFRVINHNGTDYIPLASNNVTPNDLTKLAQKAKDLVQLGAQYDIHLDVSRCSVNGQKLVDCYGPVQQTINGHKLNWFSLDTAKTTTVSALGSTPLERTTLNLSITMDGKDYDFNMDYDANSCVDTKSLR
jgi:hypothetical protein